MASLPMREYRIHKRGDDFFPQVRRKAAYVNIWGPWHKIARHLEGSFGLYSLPDHGHPKSENECRIIIEEYEEWTIKKSNSEDEYIEYNTKGENK